MFGTHQTITKGKKTRYGKDVDTITNRIYNSKQGRTDYAATLINPALKFGARIPDLACYPTATYTTEYHASETVSFANATSNTQLLHVDLHAAPSIYRYQGQHGTAPGEVTSPASVTAIGPGDAALQSRYKSARLVSAMVKVSYADNDTATTGTIYGAYLPPDFKICPNYNFNGGGLANSNPLICATPAYWLKVPDYYVGPIKNGVVCRYKPQDSSCFNMYMPNITDPINTTGSGTGGVQGDRPSPFGAFLIYFDKPSGSSALTVQLDVVLNWEGIVLTTDVGIPSGMSGADPGALAHGFNAAGGAATAFSATPSSIAKNIDDVLRRVA